MLLLPPWKKRALSGLFAARMSREVMNHIPPPGSAPATGTPAEPEIITFGCRLNSYESEVMRAHARRAGLGDVTLVNTCAVTGEAVRQARQRIRRIRRQKPQTRIIVTGCAAQVETARFAEMAEVDHVLGNDEKLDYAAFAALAAQAPPRIQRRDIMTVHSARHHQIDQFGSRARAYVQIQNGCDHRCTFCIIPHGRGPSRSVLPGEIVAQVHHLVDRGYLEIVLTGVDITAYGADLEATTSLGLLVQRLLVEVPGLRRLRLSSIDALESDAALLEAMASEERLMPHLHLSLQAGDDLILKRMKRRHLRADAIRFCNQMRQARPDIAFGADLIAGFPTESEAMFANSLSLIEACGLSFLHVFPYSPRPDTPAARMPQLPRAVIRERAARLRAAGDVARGTFLAGLKGQRFAVLRERHDSGHTPHFAPVRLQERGQPGQICTVEITGVADGVALGREVA